MENTPSRWNPEQYERFKGERSRPFFDLLALVRPRPGMRVVDLGCGTGELTRELHLKLGAAETLGLDSSEAMLHKAAAFAGGGLRFECLPFEIFGSTSPLDLVVSYAALHWVDGQPALLGRLASMLAPGGQLAVQVPANEDHPSHTVAAEVAREWSRLPPRSAGTSAGRRTLRWTSTPHEAPRDLGFRDQVVRMQVYGNALPSSEGVVEWVKGTLLTDYEKRMPAELFPRFVERYRDRLVARLGGGAYFFPFKRILFWGQRG